MGSDSRHLWMRALCAAHCWNSLQCWCQPFESAVVSYLPSSALSALLAKLCWRCSPCAPLQEGDLEQWLKARDGKLLGEGEVMLKFVQLCLALQHVHSKVSGGESCTAAGRLLN